MANAMHGLRKGHAGTAMWKNAITTVVVVGARVGVAEWN
jgi:hypothetical protein